MSNPIIEAAMAIVAEPGLSDLKVSIAVKAIFKVLPNRKAVLYQVARELQTKTSQGGGRAYILSNMASNLELRAELIDPQYPYPYLLD